MEVVAAMMLARSLIAGGAEIFAVIERAVKEKREFTPDEVNQITARRKEVEADFDKRVEEAKARLAGR